MKRSAALVLLLLICNIAVFSLGAEASFKLFGKGKNRIISDACVMSYSDAFKGKTTVVRSDPIVIYIKDKRG